MTQFLCVPWEGTTVDEDLPGLERKRRAVWDNTERNRFIADIASKVVKTPRKTLRNLGVDLEKVDLPQRTRQRVVVLAEIPEQARRLAEMLPNWEVQDAIPRLVIEGGW